MSLGLEALGRLALGQAAGSAVTALTAANGGFSLTGRAATFNSTLVIGFGGFTLAGETQTLAPHLVALGGSFTLSGGVASFGTVFAEAQGFTSIEQTLGGAALGELALGQGVGSFGAKGTLSLSAVLTGEAVNSSEHEIAGNGLFTLSGAKAFLSWDYLGGGGAIGAGTFSRGRWHALQQELAAERESERRKREEEKRRRREAREAAAAAERERREAAWARIDVANAAAAAERALSHALAVAAHIERERAAMRHAAVLHALAIAAQEKARAQDEEEALALLLAA
jgi:hypothetical protein